MHKMIAVLTLLCAPAVAQQTVSASNSPITGTLASDPTTYGSQDEVVYAVPAVSFLPFSSARTYNTGANQRWLTSDDGCCLFAPIHLPAGANIIGFEVAGCDNSPSGQLALRFLACATVGCLSSFYILSGVPDTPGCVNLRMDVNVPRVDNTIHAYSFEFGNAGDIDGDVRISSARIYYKLQVSPAPATPTFADVPVNHPFYRFIEALAAAGITAGCGGGNYCPDAPLTRGQMAVFLSAALGLHWAP